MNKHHMLTIEGEKHDRRQYFQSDPRTSAFHSFNLNQNHIFITIKAYFSGSHDPAWEPELDRSCGSVGWRRSAGIAVRSLERHCH